MTAGLYIFRDDEFETPIYADGEFDDLEADAREALIEAVTEAISGDGATEGVQKVGSLLVAWLTLSRLGISFGVAVKNNEDVNSDMLRAYLLELSERYLDDLGETRYPENDGLGDLVVDVIPPWED